MTPKINAGIVRHALAASRAAGGAAVRADLGDAVILVGSDQERLVEAFRAEPDPRDVREDLIAVQGAECWIPPVRR